jgi:hypothetical protein
VGGWEKTVTVEQPHLTAEVRAQTQATPNSWIYSVNPGYEPDGRGARIRRHGGVGR